MAYNLPIGSYIKNKYVVQKVLFTSETMSVYLVFDKKITGKNWVAKEFIFDPSLAEEDIKQRRLKLYEAIESLKLFNHKSLAKIIEYFTFHQKDYIIMEYVEGVTFEDYITNFAAAPSEQQIIKWAAELCDILHYFGNRPNPYIFGILDPARIMLDKDDNIRLINYGINRFFGAIEPVVFSSESIYFAKELNSFGSFLIFLAAKIKTTDIQVLQNFSYSDEFRQIIAKCLDPKAHLVYGTFEEIKELFEDLKAKKEAPKAPVPKFKLTAKALKEKFLIKIQNLIFTFSIQKMRYKIMEAIAFIFLLVIVFVLANPVYKFTKQGPVVYVLCNDKEIICLDPQSHKTLDKIITEISLNYIKSDSRGKYLYISSSDKNISKIKAINCENNKFDPKINITVDIDPQNILIDERNNKLYVLNKISNNISVVDLKLNKMTAIIPTGKSPADIEDFNLKPYIFVANTDSETISVINKENEKVLFLINTIDAPYALKAVEKEEKVFAACQDVDSLKFYTFYQERNGLFYRTSQISDIGGKKPVSMHIDDAGHYIYAANTETNNISVIDLTDNKLKTSIEVGKKPINMIFIKPNYLWVINQASNTITILNTYTNTVYSTIPVGKNPSCITYAP